VELFVRNNHFYMEVLYFEHDWRISLVKYVYRVCNYRMSVQMRAVLRVCINITRDLMGEWKAMNNMNLPCFLQARYG